MANQTMVIIKSLTNLVDFMKTRTKENLLAKHKEWELSRRQLEQICNLVDASIAAAYQQGVDSVMNEIEKK